jgi:hypothetical protein
VPQRRRKSECSCWHVPTRIRDCVYDFAVSSTPYSEGRHVRAETSTEESRKAVRKVSFRVKVCWTKYKFLAVTRVLVGMRTVLWCMQ